MSVAFKGKWRIWSHKDPRWDSDGTSEVGGDRIPEEIAVRIGEFSRKLGSPPDDLEWEYKLE
jgi:hypothetical protein